MPPYFRCGQPACTQACPTGALSLGERAADALEAMTTPGLAPTGLGPALVVLPARRVKPVETTLAGEPGAAPVPQPLPPLPKRLHQSRRLPRPQGIAMRSGLLKVLRTLPVVPSNSTSKRAGSRNTSQ